MHVSVITLRYDPARGILDDTTLRDFVHDKVVIAVRDHFFLVGNTPHLALVIEYRAQANPLPASASARARDLLGFRLLRSR